MLIFVILMLIFVIFLTATVIVNMWLGVPFVPSSRRAIQAILETVPLKTTDRVYELGSGSGCLAFALHKKYGCSVTGFEIAPLPWLWSVIAQKIKRRKKVRFLLKNFLNADLKADVLYGYLMPGMLDKLAQKIEQEKIHTTVVSHSFAIHRWKPAQTIARDPIKKTPVIYIYQT